MEIPITYLTRTTLTQQLKSIKFLQRDEHGFFPLTECGENEVACM